MRFSIGLGIVKNAASFKFRGSAAEAWSVIVYLETLG
jgi:hypothetical protein